MMNEVNALVWPSPLGIGMIDHHTLQVESPEEVANDIRYALNYIEPESLILSSDCGMGREGMSRRHAFYKMVSLVQGVNLHVTAADALVAAAELGRYGVTVNAIAPGPIPTFTPSMSRTSVSWTFFKRDENGEPGMRALLSNRRSWRPPCRT